jgi:hypothetical protein
MKRIAICRSPASGVGGWSAGGSTSTRPETFVTTPTSIGRARGPPKPGSGSRSAPEASESTASSNAKASAPIVAEVRSSLRPVSEVGCPARSHAMMPAAAPESPSAHIHARRACAAGA